MPDNAKCPMTGRATDEEIASLFRVAAKHKTGKGTIVDIADNCVLDLGHAGDCAAYVATLGGHPASAWVRWGAGGRRMDWLADCPGDGCALFLDHPGDCDDCGKPGGDRRRALDMPPSVPDPCETCRDTPGAEATCPECGMTGAES
jgi:hypothetical protein